MVILSCLFSGMSVASWNALDVLSVSLFPVQLRYYYTVCGCGLHYTVCGCGLHYTVCGCGLHHTVCGCGLYYTVCGCGLHYTVCGCGLYYTVCGCGLHYTVCGCGLHYTVSTALLCRGAEPQHTVVVLCVYPSVCLSVCPLDFLQDGTESAAENCNISITREYLENDGLRFSI